MKGITAENPHSLPQAVRGMHVSSLLGYRRERPRHYDPRQLLPGRDFCGLLCHGGEALTTVQLRARFAAAT